MQWLVALAGGAKSTYYVVANFAAIPAEWLGKFQVIWGEKKKWKKTSTLIRVLRN